MSFNSSKKILLLGLENGTVNVFSYREIRSQFEDPKPSKKKKTRHSLTLTRNDQKPSLLSLFKCKLRPSEISSLQTDAACKYLFAGFTDRTVGIFGFESISAEKPHLLQSIQMPSRIRKLQINNPLGLFVAGGPDSGGLVFSLLDSPKSNFVHVLSPQRLWNWLCFKNNHADNDQIWAFGEGSKLRIWNIQSQMTLASDQIEKIPEWSSELFESNSESSNSWHDVGLVNAKSPRTGYMNKFKNLSGYKDTNTYGDIKNRVFGDIMTASKEYRNVKGAGKLGPAQEFKEETPDDQYIQLLNENDPELDFEASPKFEMLDEKGRFLRKEGRFVRKGEKEVSESESDSESENEMNPWYQ